MSSDKPPQGEGIFGGLISLFWNKKAAPATNPVQSTTSPEANKGHDYLTWSDNVIKKSSELVVLLEDHTAPTSRLLALMNEVDPLLQVEHDTASLRAPNDAKVSATLLALGFALLQLLTASKTQQEVTLALKLMAKLLVRSEFDILHPMAVNGIYRWTPDQQKKARQYRSLLIKLQIMIATNLADSPIVEPNGSIISISQTLSMYPRLLAILYWRLPYVGVLIRKAVSLHLKSTNELQDFTVRPEPPAPPVVPPVAAAKPTASALPKRGRVKADSKAPPPMSFDPASVASSSGASTSNSSGQPQRSSSAGAKGTPPVPTVMRPHSGSMRTPPVFDATGTLTSPSNPPSATSSESNAPLGAESTTNTDGQGTTTTTTPTPVSPPPERLSLLSVSGSTQDMLSELAIPPHMPSSSDILLLQDSRSASPPPPTSSSPPPVEVSITNNTSSSNPSKTATSGNAGTAAAASSTTGTGAISSATSAGNAKLTKRPAANANGFMTVPTNNPKANATAPTFSFKVVLTPTSVELDDDLMEHMVLPKTGEIPYYKPFDPNAPTTHPTVITWASWMRVSKRLGFISSDGQFSPITSPPPATTNSTAKAKKGAKPTASGTMTSTAVAGSSSSASSSGSGDKKPAGGASSSGIVSSTEPSQVMGARCLLYNWVNFHQTLVEMGPEANPSPGCIPSPMYFVEHEPRIEWLTWFEGGNSLIFVLFFKEWVNHTSLMLSRTNEFVGLDWNTVPGYKQMELALLGIYHPTMASRLSMPLLDASRPMVRCNPELVSWFVKYTFNQTNAHSTDSVNAMFSKMEMWFAELDRNLYRLPASFDVDYFLVGLDIIISIDHHIVLARLLSFIFTYAHTFRGKIRRAIIEEFLVKKHFFTLFLHWDDVVRNYYQQFLIYKTVRIRKLPHVRHGLIPPTPESLLELKELSANNHSLPVNRRSTYGAISVQASVPVSGGISPSANQSNGIPMLPFAANSFTAGVDAEGFLVDSTDDEYLQDMRLFTITESLVRIVEDQITQAGKRDPTAPEAQTAYPKSLEIYAPRSLSEYNFYLARYEQKYMCAKILPLSIIQEKRINVPRSSKPKNSD